MRGSIYKKSRFEFMKHAVCRGQKTTKWCKLVESSFKKLHSKCKLINGPREIGLK